MELELFPLSELRSCVSVRRGGRPGLPGRPNEPYGVCGRKATFNHAHVLVTVCP